MGKLAKHSGHTLEIYQILDTPYNRFVLRCKDCGCEVTSEDNVDDGQAKTIRDKAKVLYESDDDVEVDDDAVISMTDDGCWVQGWLWLSDYDFKGDKEGKKPEEEPEKKPEESLKFPVWIQPQPSVTEDIDSLDGIDKTELIGNGNQLLLMTKIREIARILKRHLAKSMGGK